MRTIFVQKFEGDSYCLTGSEHHHLSTVLRSKCGDVVVLCCGDGYENIGKITKIERDATHIDIIERRLSDKENTIQTTLFQAVSKADRMELIAQKMTELGVNRIVPFMSKHCAVNPQSLKQARIDKIILEAAKQCGRAVLPEFCQVASFEQMLMQLTEYDLVIFANEKEPKKLLKNILENAKNNKNKIKKIAIIIGCEGGFSDHEANSIQQSGAHSTGLGGRILRLETASIVVASIILNFFEQI